MRVEVTYYAFDGEEFSTKEECLAYEEGLRSGFDSVLFFDESKAIMESPDAEDIEKDAYFVLVLDEGKARGLFEWLRYQISFEWGEEDVIKGDYYKWTEDGWVNINRVYRECEENLKKMKEEAKKSKKVNK